MANDPLDVFRRTLLTLAKRGGDEYEMPLSGWSKALLRERLHYTQQAKDCVMECIDWTITKEGGAFWSYVHGRLEEIENEYALELARRDVPT